MENRPSNNNNNLIGAVGSFNLSDSQQYYVIPETDNKFVEVLDNKGEIDPDFERLSTTFKQCIFQF